MSFLYGKHSYFETFHVSYSIIQLYVCLYASCADCSYSYGGSFCSLCYSAHVDAFSDDRVCEFHDYQQKLTILRRVVACHSQHVDIHAYHTPIVLTSLKAIVLHAC